MPPKKRPPPPEPVDIEDTARLQGALLGWYDANKRTLPWRTRCDTTADANERGYAVWVSEIMLQQTRVATVVEYYNRWMARWPTMAALAAAPAEAVREAWTGLGYYSRATRLHAGAKLVVEGPLAGELPQTPGELQKIPGIGPYTAGAIASIAFGARAAAVDGNVVRVLARLTGRAALPAPQQWATAEALVSAERAGDWTQAMMELGATVCTPTSPSCATCPIAQHCKVRTQGLDPEQYPEKVAKKAKREEAVNVCVVSAPALAGTGSSEPMYLLLQRPDKGLLAGMWEFPSVAMAGEGTETGFTERRKQMGLFLADEAKIPRAAQRVGRESDCGTATHLFTHIRQTLFVSSLALKSPVEAVPAHGRWVTRGELAECAVSTNMRKAQQLALGKGKGKGSKAKVEGPMDQFVGVGDRKGQR